MHRRMLQLRLVRPAGAPLKLVGCGLGAAGQVLRGSVLVRGQRCCSNGILQATVLFQCGPDKLPQQGPDKVPQQGRKKLECLLSSLNTINMTRFIAGLRLGQAWEATPSASRSAGVLTSSGTSGPASPAKLLPLELLCAQQP